VEGIELVGCLKWIRKSKVKKKREKIITERRKGRIRKNDDRPKRKK